jgi:hypothetical protein
VVLLSRRQGKWRPDTLTTWAAPTSVQLVVNADSADVTALIATSYFDRKQGRVWSSSLFLAPYDSAWHDLRFGVAGHMNPDKSRNIGSPQAIRAGSRLVVAWVSSSGEKEGIEYSPNLEDTLSVSVPVAPLASSLGGYAMTQLDPQRVLWLVRRRESKGLLRVLIGTNSSTFEAGEISLPLDNLVTVAIAESDSSVLVVTGGLGKPNEPLATSYLSRLRVRCAGAR